MSEYIKEVPHFKHDLDDLTLSKLTDAEKYIVTALSEIRQHQRWNSEKVMESYNRGLNHEKLLSTDSRDHHQWIKKMLWRGVVTVLSLLLAGAAAAVTMRWLGPPNYPGNK
jgi:hypothetical protein